MKKYVLLIIALTLLVGCVPPFSCEHKHTAQLNPDITAEEITGHIKYLASDELAGRFPGTPESKLAQDYITKQLKNADIQPLDENGYLQKFEFVSDVVTGNNNSLSIGNNSYKLGEDFIPLGFSENADLTADAAFVGYGFSIDDSVKWNDYQNVEVSGKWAIILRGGPDDDNPHSIYNTHLPLRKKVLLAKDRGASGVLFVTQFSDEDDELIKLRYDNSFSGAGIPVIHISQKVAEDIFSNLDTDFINVQESLKEIKQPHSFDLPSVKIAAVVELEKTYSDAANIIAVVPGNDPELKNEYVVIGGHYDHLGMGGEGSGSRVPDTLAVHNGADDNASGVAGVIEVGEKLAARQKELKRSIILMNFDAEERGLLGSKHFIDNSNIDINNIITMLNIDMIGHLSENSLTVGGTGTSPIFDEILKEINKKYSFDLHLSPEGFGPSDHATFYSKDIPVLFFFTGTHDDYHKPSDDFPIINVDGEKAIADFTYDIALQLCQAPERPQFTEAGPKESSAPSRGFKVTFGIVPAYGSQVDGMEVDGVRKEGPADRSGMQKGDIITAIGDKEINNIYDYMYRLGELKKGQTVSVTVLRGEKTVKLNLDL